MPIFEREMDRYIVFKRSDLTDEQIERLERLTVAPRGPAASSHDNPLPTVECVVVEADWPIYDKVWALVEDQWVSEITEEK